MEGINNAYQDGSVADYDDDEDGDESDERTNSTGKRPRSSGSGGRGRGRPPGVKNKEKSIGQLAGVLLGPPCPVKRGGHARGDRASFHWQRRDRFLALRDKLSRYMSETELIIAQSELALDELKQSGVSVPDFVPAIINSSAATSSSPSSILVEGASTYFSSSSLFSNSAVPLASMPLESTSSLSSATTPAVSASGSRSVPVMYAPLPGLAPRPPGVLQPGVYFGPGMSSLSASLAASSSAAQAMDWNVAYREHFMAASIVASGSATASDNNGTSSASSAADGGAIVSAAFDHAAPSSSASIASSTAALGQPPKNEPAATATLYGSPSPVSPTSVPTSAQEHDDAAAAMGGLGQPPASRDISELPSATFAGGSAASLGDQRTKAVASEAI